MTSDQINAKLLLAALDDIVRYRKALQTIADGNAMAGLIDFSHADVILEYQSLARKALK